jgi:hypothetical protein
MDVQKGRPQVATCCAPCTVLLQKPSGACLFLEAPLLCCDSEQVGNDSVLCEDITLWNTLELAFPDHMHGLIALDGPLRSKE